VKRGAIVTLDTLTWQLLASVFWPGSFIRCVVNATTVALALAHVSPRSLKLWKTRGPKTLCHLKPTLIL